MNVVCCVHDLSQDRHHKEFNFVEVLVILEHVDGGLHGPLHWGDQHVLKVYAFYFRSVVFDLEGSQGVQFRVVHKLTFF